METLFLTVAGPAGEVFPRRMRLGLSQGSGRLVWPQAPILDEAWRRSASSAWQAAMALSGRTDRDAHLEVASPHPLAGGSAGLPFGLLALAALLGLPGLPPHAATGAVGPHGMAWGGRGAAVKGAFVGRNADALGLRGAPFLVPPLSGGVGEGGGAAVPVVDLATALRRLVPEAYPAVAARHRAIRGRAAEGWAAAADTARPFVVLRHAEPPPGGLAVAGLQVVRSGEAGSGRVAWAAVGDAGELSWEGPLEGGLPSGGVAGLWERVRAADLAAGPGKEP